MTQRQFEALEIIDAAGTIAPSTFGMKFWPGHVMHSKSSPCGNGAARGVAGWRCAGGYLGRLRKKGWVWDEGRIAASYTLTFAGAAALKEERSKRES